MAPHNRVQTSQNEGSIMLAMSAYHSGQCDSISAAARTYKVSKATLCRRIQGTASREDYTPYNKKLTKIEEEALIKDVLKLDDQGLSPSLALVKDMANTIHHARGGQGVGTNWTQRFIKRTPALSTRLGRTYECQRRLCEDPGVIEGWFRLVQNQTCPQSI